MSTEPDAVRQDARARGGLSSPTLIGRAREEKLVLEALTSPPGLILVEGEAGIGKSRLVRETLEQPALRSVRVLSGHCHRLREPFLLGPVIEALRGLVEQPPEGPLSPVVGALQPLLPELADILPPPPVDVGDRRAERHRVFRAIRELVDASGPTVCVLEDLHWTDEGTLEFLEFLLTQPPEGLALVLTYRPEDLPSSSRLVGLSTGMPAEALRATIELAPLPVEEVQSLVAAILETDEVSDDLVRLLHERTGGIPFVLEECLRLLRDRGQLTLTDGTPAIVDSQQVDVPPAIRQAIRERMEPFSRDAGLVTRAAAVIGVPAREDLLAGVAGLARARAVNGLSRALSSALLEEEAPGLYGFRHALAAQAVYDETPAPERRRLHQRAGQALAAGPHPHPHAQLAHHFRLADRPKQWAHHAEAAAEIARSIGDDRAAVRLLEQALSVPGLSRAAKIRLAIGLGRAAPHSECPERSIGLLQEILEKEPMAVGTRGELRFLLSQLRYCTGDGGLWHEEMVRAVGELGRRPQLAVRAMLQLAWPMLREGDVEDDLDWLRRAVQLAEGIDDAATRTGIYAQRAAILLCVGDPAGWRALEDIPAEGPTVEEKLQLLRGYHSLSGVLRSLGHYSRAEGFLSEVTRLNEELDHVWWGPWLESARVSLDWCTGRWEGLELRAGGLATSGSGTATLAVSSELIRGSLLLVRGEIGQAEETFASVLEESQRRGWLGARATASAWLARIHLLQDDARSARQVAAIGLDVVRHKRIWIWGREVVPVAVQAFLACRQRVEAKELAEQFAAGVAGRVAPAARAASYFSQGVVAEAEGSHRAAAALFEKAEDVWSELPCPYDAARAREGRARSLLADGDEEGADILLGALEAFDNLPAISDAARARAELTSLGLTVPSPSRGGRRAYGDELSPREAEVVRLAGSGRKNREIADALFISPRTVEAHVASAIRKLGVESRQELASATSLEAKSEAD